jgi:hypothetical protein
MWQVIMVVLFVLTCVAWMNYHKYKLEPFTSGNTPKDLTTKIKNMNTELFDILNVTTYRSSYEDMILELETWANHSMLNLLAQGKIGKDTVDKSIESIRMFNDLHTFKKNLNDTMAVVDKTT